MNELCGWWAAATLLPGMLPCWQVVLAQGARHSMARPVCRLRMPEAPAHSQWLLLCRLLCSCDTYRICHQLVVVVCMLDELPVVSAAGMHGLHIDTIGVTGSAFVLATSASAAASQIPCC